MRKWLFLCVLLAGCGHDRSVWLSDGSCVQVVEGEFSGCRGIVDEQWSDHYVNVNLGQHGRWTFGVKEVRPVVGRGVSISGKVSNEATRRAIESDRDYLECLYEVCEEELIRLNTGYGELAE